MKALTFTAAIIALLLGASVPADAARYRHYYHRHVTSHHFGRYLATRHYRRTHRYTHIARRQPRFVHRRASDDSKPSCFWTAASMGGPCGCWAESFFLDITQHVWKGINMWLADDWRRFPSTPEPAPLTAAVFPHRHVVPVRDVRRDRQGKVVAVLLHDSWGDHWRGKEGLVFVSPPIAISRVIREGRLYKYQGGVL